MAFDWESALFGAVITGAISTLGFLGKRMLPGERRRAKAEEYGALATIAATMKEKNLSDEDVQAVAAVLRGENSQARSESIVSQVRAESEESENVQIDRYWTQASMNERAGAKYRQSESKLDMAATRFRQLLDDHEQEAFDEAQSAWEGFRDKSADFAASEFLGGSIAPLIASSEKEVLTEARARDLEAAFKERAGRQGVETE